jgi:hypothetical protein
VSHSSFNPYKSCGAYREKVDEKNTSVVAEGFRIGPFTGPASHRLAAYQL